MAALKQKFIISWPGQEPIEVRTTALDQVNSGEYTKDVPGPVAVSYGMIYAALVRTGVEVPNFHDWLLNLDDIDRVGTVVEGIEGPIQPDLSLGVPSKLPASQDLIGELGLNAMTTDPSLPQRQSSKTSTRVESDELPDLRHPKNVLQK